MRINYIAKALSLTLIYTGVVILAPVIIAILYKDYASIIPFVSAGLVSILFGLGIKKFVPNVNSIDNLNDIRKDEGLFIVALSWIAFAIIGAVPYVFFGITPLNALFESTSGITTTGATILTHFDYPKAMFFWRSLTQWIGGLGIIILFIAVLPQFAVAGRQMFFAEAPGPTEDKFTPRIRNTATSLWKIYVGLTILEIIILINAGMPWFDALCNSFSTLSAGGFSPNPESIMGYHSNAIVWIVIAFMFLAGASFNLQYRVITQKNPVLFFKSEEFRMYLGMVICMGLLIAISLTINNNYDFFKNITDGIFQVISISTSTGFASVDFEKWNYTSRLLLFVVMFIGGCASSAGGGIKIARWLVVFKTLKREILRILHPNAIVNIKLDNKTVAPEISKQIVVFICFYFLIFSISSILLAIFEQSSAVGITGAISSIGNIGPGIAVSTGPMANYDSLQPASKIIMISNMLIGRLELIPFLVLLQRDFWTFKD